jgi:hypothetical protein
MSRRKKITRRSGLFLESNYAEPLPVAGYQTGIIHFTSVSAGEAAMVSSPVEVPMAAVSVA